MVIGVDDACYGWALRDARCWYPLPRWAQVFVMLCESRVMGALTAYDAVGLLAEAEGLLAVPGRLISRKG